MKPILFLLTAAALLTAASGPPSASGAAGPRYLRVALRPQNASDNIDPKAVRAALDRDDTAVERVLTPGDAQMILVVLDLTGDLGSIEPAKQKLIEQIEKLPAVTYAGLMRAQDGLTVLTDPGPDRAAAIEAVRNLTVTGRPGLLETLEQVERLADSIARKAHVRMAVLYVTDGDVQMYREDFTNPVINSSDPHDLSRRFPETLVQEKFSKLGTTFNAFETPLHIVQIAYRGDRLNEAYQNGMKRITEVVAGTFELCRSRAEIPEAIDRAFAAIAGSYSAVLPVPPHAPKSLQIQISAGDTPVVFRSRIDLKEKP